MNAKPSVAQAPVDAATRRDGPDAGREPGRPAASSATTQPSFCEDCHRDMEPRDHTTLFRHAHARPGRLRRPDPLPACATRPDFCIRCHEYTSPRSHRGQWARGRNTHCAVVPPAARGELRRLPQGLPAHDTAPPLPRDTTRPRTAASCHIPGRRRAPPLRHVDNGHGLPDSATSSAAVGLRQPSARSARGAADGRPRMCALRAVAGRVAPRPAAAAAAPRAAARRAPRRALRTGAAVPSAEGQRVEGGATRSSRSTSAWSATAFAETRRGHRTSTGTATWRRAREERRVVFRLPREPRGLSRTPRARRSSPSVRRVPRRQARGGGRRRARPARRPRCGRHATIPGVHRLPRSAHPEQGMRRLPRCRTDDNPERRELTVPHQTICVVPPRRAEPLVPRLPRRGEPRRAAARQRLARAVRRSRTASAASATATSTATGAPGSTADASGSWNGKKQYLLCVHCHDSARTRPSSPSRPMPAARPPGGPAMSAGSHPPDLPVRRRRLRRGGRRRLRRRHRTRRFFRKNFRDYTKEEVDALIAAPGGGSARATYGKDVTMGAEAPAARRRVRLRARPLALHRVPPLRLRLRRGEQPEPRSRRSTGSACWRWTRSAASTSRTRTPTTRPRRCRGPGTSTCPWRASSARTRRA